MAKNIVIIRNTLNMEAFFNNFANGKLQNTNKINLEISYFPHILICKKICKIQKHYNKWDICDTVVAWQFGMPS